MRILIAGCGYVGRALGERLASEGHTVFGARRNPQTLPPKIRLVTLDLSKPISPDELPPDLDFVFYTASAGGFAGGYSEDAYRTAYVEGPRNLLSALETQDVRRVLFTSSTGVYGQRDGEWVDEGSPTEPESSSGRTLLEGEQVFLEGPFPIVVLRLGGIYGPGRTRSLERALQGEDDGEPAVYSNRIHRDDCAGALRHLMLLEEPEQVYLGVDHEPTDRRTVAGWLEGRLSPETSRADGPSGTPRRRTNKRCSNARLVASGYRFLYPTFREGFAALLGETVR